jgi:hypothetical protein
MLEIKAEHGHRNDAFRLEICPDNKREAATLMVLIKKHVAPGTTLVKELWRGCFGLDGEGYYHLTVNHAQEFINPLNGANIQTIESSWSYLKRKLVAAIVHDHLADHLCEYLYGREVKIKKLDSFLTFVDAIKAVYNPYEN